MSSTEVTARIVLHDEKAVASEQKQVVQSNMTLKILKSYEPFGDAERSNLLQEKRQKASQDSTVTMQDLVQFSKVFKLKTPVPSDLQAILGTDDHIARQRKIAQEPQRHDVAQAQVMHTTSKPEDFSSRVGNEHIIVTVEIPPVAAHSVCQRVSTSTTQQPLGFKRSTWAQIAVQGSMKASGFQGHLTDKYDVAPVPQKRTRNQRRKPAKQKASL